MDPAAATSQNPVTELVDQIEELEGPGGEVADDIASTAAGWLREQPWVAALTKVGWVAKAIVYAAIGWAAIVIAFGRPGSADAEYTGVVALLAERPGSRVMLATVAVGLAFYVAFRVLSVLLIDEVDLDAWMHRIGYSVSAGSYVVVAWAALDAAITGVDAEGGSSFNRVTATVMRSLPGRIAVAVAAIGAFAVAGYFIYKGAARRFMKQLDTDDLSERHRQVLEWVGAVGWIGRGGVVAAIAAFLIGAAVQADPNDVRGLDRSLQEVAVSSRAGAVAVFVIGLLLLLYALFSALSAPHRSLAWSWRNDPDPD